MKFNSLAKSLIKELIQHEETEEDKLDMLTSIGITSRNKDVFSACEEIRNEMCEDTKREMDSGDRDESDLL